MFRTAEALTAHARREGAWGLLLCVADLHSPYRRLARILGAARALAAAAGSLPLGVVVNGDVFEAGNVAALRSGAAADWRFLAELAGLGPMAVNFGNHETALIDDASEVAARIAALGAQPIGGLILRADGRFVAPPTATLALGGRSVGLLGLSLQDPTVYRDAALARLRLSDPAALAASHLPALRGADALVIASHAGVADDARVLPMAPPDALLFGSHHHLTFSDEVDGVTVAHGGAYGAELGVAALRDSGPPLWLRLAPSTAAAADAGLAATIADVCAEHLTEADREVIAAPRRARSVAQGVDLALAAVRRATGADVAMLGHTSFGAGLPAGSLTRFDFDAFLRFEDSLALIEMDGAALGRAMARANQHRRRRLSGRTGDFLHASPAPNGSGRWKVVVNGWAARRQAEFLGVDDLDFTPIADLGLKQTVEAALRDSDPAA